MARLRFWPSTGTVAGNADGISGERPLELESSPAFNLLSNLQRAGAPIRHDCGGKAQCGTCRVEVLAVPRGGLSFLDERERARLAAAGAPTDGSVRLACQLRVAREAEFRALVPLSPNEDR